MLYEVKKIIEDFTNADATIVPLTGKKDESAIDTGSNSNLGLVIGDASGGLVDNNLDDQTALEFADWLLPETGIRPSKPTNHARPLQLDLFDWADEKDRLIDNEARALVCPLGSGRSQDGGEL